MTEIFHEPVMVSEVMPYLLARKREVIVDCTAGDGGHSEAILGAAKGTFLIALDVDSEAVSVAKERLAAVFPGRFLALKGDYREISRVLAVLGVPKVDGALLDLGVSSRQLDLEERGFTYWGDGPLDMRMDLDAPLTAKDILMTCDQEGLKRILWEYGEERFASRIAREIIRRRSTGALETAQDLVGAVRKAIPARYRQNGSHPARRTFQALRIATNDEISRLGVSLKQVFYHLRPGGTVVVLSYHSLEDRIVKSTFRELENKGYAKRLTKKPKGPGETEVRANPRARSAKLRALEKA